MSVVKCDATCAVAAQLRTSMIHCDAQRVKNRLVGSSAIDADDGCFQVDVLCAIIYYFRVEFGLMKFLVIILLILAFASLSFGQTPSTSPTSAQSASPEKTRARTFGSSLGK